MFKDKGIIFPPNLLGQNVESLMFTKEFLKEIKKSKYSYKNPRIAINALKLIENQV